MNTTKLIMAAALATLTVSAAAADDSAEGDAGIKAAARLCDGPDETAELACGTRDDRLVAVCARTGGMLRLIIRQEGQPDIALPNGKADGTVSTGSNRLASGGGTHARFRTDALDYVAYIGFGPAYVNVGPRNSPGWWGQAGVSEVSRSRETKNSETPHLAKHTCLPASHIYDGGFPISGDVAGLSVDDEPTFHIPLASDLSFIRPVKK